MATNSEINEPPDKPTSENDLRNKATSGRNFKSRLRTRLQFIGGRSPNLPLLARSLAGSLVIGMAAMVNLSFASGIFCRDDPQNGSHTAKTLSGHGADVPSRPGMISRLCRDAAATTPLSACSLACRLAPLGNPVVVLLRNDGLAARDEGGPFR
jgi:hypothetical protein